MTKRAEDIRPGATMTGRDLRDIFVGERTMVYGSSGTTARRLGSVVTLSTPTPPGHVVAFWARVTSQTRDGANWRWFYGFTEIVWINADTFEDKISGARTSEVYGNARNAMEAINGASGLTGCGVNVDNLPDGFELQPIPLSVPLVVTLTPSKDGESALPHFSVPNGVDGACGALTAQQAEITSLQQETQSLRGLLRRLFR